MTFGAKRVKLAAVLLASIAHGALAIALFAEEPVLVAGAPGHAAMRLGGSFEDLAEPVQSAHRPDAPALTAETSEDLQRPVQTVQKSPLSDHARLSDHTPQLHQTLRSDHAPLSDHTPRSDQTLLSAQVPLSRHLPLSEHVPLSEKAPLSDHAPLTGHVSLTDHETLAGTGPMQGLTASTAKARITGRPVTESIAAHSDLTPIPAVPTMTATPSPDARVLSGSLPNSVPPIPVPRDDGGPALRAEQAAELSVIHSEAGPRALEVVEGAAPGSAAVARSLRPVSRRADFVKPPVRKTSPDPEQTRSKPAKPPKAPAGTAVRKKIAGAPEGTRPGTARSSGASASTSRPGQAAVTNYPGVVRRCVLRRAGRAGGGRGTAHVAFQVSSDGGIRNVTLARSSGHAALDRSALAAVRRVGRCPRPPQGAQRSFSVAVSGR